MKAKLRIFLFGQFKNRVPFHYPVYRSYFSPFFEMVENPEDADFLVCGFFGDIKTSAELIANVKAKIENVRLVVFSEEPLWDTLWYYRWKRPVHDVIVDVQGNEQKWSFHFMNHANTDIFDFHQLPYFITTENIYLQRYVQLLKLQQSQAPHQLLQKWRSAATKYTFIAEKRLRDAYDKKTEQGDLLGLSVYRTRLALEMAARAEKETLCLGKGWNSEQARQSLADWHLSKLASLKDESFIVSAVENTILDNYVSEKPFDAVALGALPVYWAGKSHRIFEFFEPQSFINIAGLDYKSAASKLLDFEPTTDTVESLLDSQQRLLARLTEKNVLANERYLVAAKTFTHFSELHRH